jgi:hypothetical protein
MANMCMVQVNTPVTVTANFTLNTYAVTVQKMGTGTGNVTSSPAGISCGADCTENFNHGTPVTLSASAGAGATFMGWSGGGCTGTGQCTVTVTAATTVTATFNVVQWDLTVQKAGNGSGTVTSNPAGINCGADCAEPYNNGTIVTLTAAPTTGSVFNGWSGAGCSGMGSCTVTMDAAKSVTATFTLTTFALNVDIVGSGGVDLDPPGLQCAGDCTQTYNYGTTVTLAASAASGYTFTGWSGAGCTGTGTCIVAMTQVRDVQAVFTINSFALDVNRSGTGAANGTVTSAPAGINCGADCSESYNAGTSVTLTASVVTGTTFNGWSNGCIGTTPMCTVTMNAAKSVTATFTLNTYALSVSKTGSGSGLVTSMPAGINCGATCSSTFNHGTMVTLTPTPSPGSKFVSWSGACAGSGSCTVNMTQIRSVSAQFDIIPPNYVFVTSTATTGAISFMGFTGVSAADKICQARAAAAGLPPNKYLAWLSTSSENAAARLGSARGWVRVDGTPVADKLSDLTTNHLFYPIKLDEFGNVVPEGIYAMTGTFGGGTYDSGGNCNDYTSTTGGVRGGWPSADSGLFSSFARPVCTTSMRLYCFGVDNAAVVSLPQDSVRRAFTSNMKWTPGNGIQEADDVCQKDADNAGLGGSFKALLATNGDAAIARFDLNGKPWARPDGALLAEKASDLALGTLTHVLASPSSNPENTAWYANNRFLWSGAPDLVTKGTDLTTCKDWTTGGADPYADFGVTGYTVITRPGGAWRGASSGGKCSDAFYLTCLEE